MNQCHTAATDLEESATEIRFAIETARRTDLRANNKHPPSGFLFTLLDGFSRHSQTINDLTAAIASRTEASAYVAIQV
jgi:hypothetical protein